MIREPGPHPHVAPHSPSQVDALAFIGVALLSIQYRLSTQQRGLGADGQEDFCVSIFGMNFFNFDTNESGAMTWILSDNVWLYWLVTIPLTLTTMAVWILWFNRNVITRIICGWTSGSSGVVRTNLLC
ncbi:hypothetical protein AFLA_008972 [Aspergillus flavus NRRL3357]|nr:hypothetical protein AFLA_008972 [Aspergillus flavus NRRL3357]